MDVDWESLFVPTGSLLEIFIRGTAIYIALFAAMRLLPRRTIGAMGAADVLVVVLIADAVSQGMSGDYRSITEALLLAGTILGWATLIDWLDFRFPRWYLAQAKALPVIEDGQLLRENMRRQNVTEDEIMSQLRQHGQDSPREVLRAFIEGDGHVSVIMRKGEPLHPPATRQHL